MQTSSTLNIAVISRKQGVFGDIDLGFKENVNMIARSQLEGAAEEDSVKHWRPDELG